MSGKFVYMLTYLIPSRSERIFEVPNPIGSVAKAFLVWFKSESSAQDVRKRARTTKLGRRPIQVDIIAESPSLQEHYKDFLMTQYSPSYTPLYLPRSGEIIAAEKENRGPRSSYPRLSTSVTRVLSPDVSGVGKRPDTFSRFPLQPLSLKREINAVASPYKSANLRSLSSPAASRLAIERMQSPLVRSASPLKRSEKISDVFHIVRPSTASPFMSSRVRNSPILRSPSIRSDRTPTPSSVAKMRAAKLSAIANWPDCQEKAARKSLLLARPKRGQMKEEINNAKGAYINSLDKVKVHLVSVERKYEWQTTKIKARRRLRSGI